jgi:hypothetical protein
MIFLRALTVSWVSLMLIAGNGHATTLNLVPLQQSRLLTPTDQNWLNRQLSTDKLQSYPVINESYPSWYGISKYTSLVAFQPEVTTNVDVTFTAPKKQFSYRQVEKGLTIEQSGQAITLPIIDSINSAELAIEALISEWMRQDLSSLRYYIQIAQQETGWSDIELIQLMSLYAATLLKESERTAFLASFWVQAGYQVQMGQVNDEWRLFYKVKERLYNTPFVDLLGHIWSPFEPMDNVSVNLISLPLSGQGQAFRSQSINSRSATTQFSRIETWFETDTRLRSIQYELPSHWAHVDRRPVSMSKQFAEPLPNFFYEQLLTLVAEKELTDQVNALAGWLKNEFELVTLPISVQQSLITKNQTVETRWVILAGWWKFLTGNALAIVELGDEAYLALELPDSLSLEQAISYRKKRWWFWSSNLEAKQAPLNPNELIWQFLP